MLRVINLNFQYTKGRHPVFPALNWSLPAGAVLYIGGINGTGKSTLLQLLAGIHTPASGSVTLASDEKSTALSTTWLREHTTLLVQEPDMYILGSTVQEDMLLALPPRDDRLKEKALQLAKDLGLESVLNADVTTLSLGQKRKLCLISALVQKPQVLLLDEPFAGMDYPAMLELCQILLQYKTQGITQIVVSHDCAPLTPLATHGLLLPPPEKDIPAVFGIFKDLLPHIEEYGIRPVNAFLSG